MGYSDNAAQTHWCEQCLHAEIKINISPIPYEIRLIIFKIDKTGHTPSQSANYCLLKELIPHPKGDLGSSQALSIPADPTLPMQAAATPECSACAE